MLVLLCLLFMNPISALTYAQKHELSDWLMFPRALCLLAGCGQ